MSCFGEFCFEINVASMLRMEDRSVSFQNNFIAFTFNKGFGRSCFASCSDLWRASTCS